MPKVTVLLPTFNRQDLIVETIKSVFTQTYSDYEVLVVDDGSTDDTEHVLKPWKSKISYIKKTNGGPSSSRNVGISRITSDYVAFLDSDDQWEPNFLERVVSVLESRPALGLVTTSRLMVPEGVCQPRIPKAHVEGDLYPLLFQRNFVTTSGTLVKRECFNTVGLFNEDLIQAGDYDMWLRISKAYPIAFLKEPLCRYRCHISNISRNELRHQLFLQQVLDANYDPKRIPEQDWRFRRSRAWISLGCAYQTLEKNALARQCFRKALDLTPTRVKLWRHFLGTWLKPNRPPGAGK